MTRTILVHLNIEVPDTDTREADEIGEALVAAVHVGSDDDEVRELIVRNVLSEEMEARA
jgi:hypothetical protein